MKKFILVLVSLTVALHVSATGTHWVPDVSQFSDNMTIVAQIYINDVVQVSADLEIGAFCNEEVRGSEILTYYGQPFDKYAVYLMIYGVANDEITFKLYDHSTETELALTSPDPLTFVPNGGGGNLNNPYIFNFTTSENPYTFSGSGSWTLPSNWKGKDGSILTELPDFSDEDVVINGMAFIPNGESVIVKSLTINEDKVLEINSGASLTVSGEINNNDDANSLVLNDGGQIFQTNEDVNATFRKNIVNPSNWEGKQKDGWQFISCPVKDFAINSFFPSVGGYDLYAWDIENGEDVPWVNCKAHYQESEDDYPYFYDNFTEGLGYLASYEKQGVLSFAGNLNNATDFNYKASGLISYSSATWGNIFFIGNPFTFDINWNDFEKNKVTDGFVTLNPNTGSYEYHTEGNINVGAGFAVQTTSSKSLKLIYSKPSKHETRDRNYINVIVSNSKGSDNAILCFNGSENGGFPKLDNFNDEIASIFTVSDNVRYGINSYDTDIQEIQLYFDAKEMGTYTISMKPTGDFGYIHLIDRMTGTDTDMLLEDEYKFIALSSDNTNRFIVRLSDSNSNPNSNCFAYQSGKMLYINELGSIQIIDMAGRVVMNETLSGNTVDISSLRNAAYIVRLVSENGVKTQKIVVR